MVPTKGAYFDVYLNGQLLTNIGPTGPDGTIAFDGADGNGLQTGYYEFVADGYLIPFIHVWVDAETPVHPLTFVNEEYPEIVIQKDRHRNQRLAPSSRS